MGVIRDVDIILCTSIYDVGISFDVNRDVEAFAVSQDNKVMPNPIDMIQFLARVRENSGYKMDLTIIGQFGTFVNNTQALPIYLSSEQITNEMAHRYKGYSYLNTESYIGLLRYYGIEALEVMDLKLQSSKIKYAHRYSDTFIALNFNNFTSSYEEVKYELECKGEGHQLDLITGEESIFSKSETREILRVKNILVDSAKKGIDFSLFIEDGKFYPKRYKAISTLLDGYKSSSAVIHFQI